MLIRTSSLYTKLLGTQPIHRYPTLTPKQSRMAPTLQRAPPHNTYPVFPPLILLGGYGPVKYKGLRNAKPE